MNKLFVLVGGALVLLSVFAYSSFVYDSDSRVISVSSNKWEGNQDVLIPSNFDSLSVKDKIKALNGESLKEVREKAIARKLVRGEF